MHTLGASKLSSLSELEKPCTHCTGTLGSSGRMYFKPITVVESQESMRMCVWDDGGWRADGYQRGLNLLCLIFV